MTAARTSDRPRWKRSEGGGRFAIWLIRTIGLYGGRSVARLLLYPITLYFYFRRGPERRGMRAYLARVQGRPGNMRQVMRIIHRFSSTLLDRVFLLSHGRKGFHLEVEGEGELAALIEQGRGVLLVGSHFGSFEVLRCLSLDHHTPPLRMVVDKQATPQLTRLLEELAPELSRQVIDVSRGGPEATVAVANALAQGQLVGLLADRSRPGEHCLKVPFLGQPASLPVTPWLLAGTLKVPVVLCFGAYLGGNRYRLMFQHFSDGIELPRHNREAALREVLARYAAALEEKVRAYPYNWFNFHDFWAGSELGTNGDQPASDN